jgi:hypothetical protein
LLGREAWPDGHVFLSARNLSAGDVIALLSDVVFATSDPRLRPPATVCVAALAERRLLVGLDDLRSAQDLAVLRCALQGSMLCFTSSEHWVTGDVAWIPLRGLKAPEGVAFVRATSGKKISDDLATKIVAHLDGNPSRILRAIGGDLDPEDISTPEAFDKLQVSRAEQELSVNEVVALAAIATFGRAALGAKSPGAALVKRCLVERSSIGWSVPEGLRRHIDRLSIEAAALAAAVLEALPEDGLSDPEATVECATGLPAVMSRGGTAAQQLAGVVCRALDRRGLWDVSTGLYQALYAVRGSLEDPKMRSWVVHQLATRLACAGEVDAARDLFNQALAEEGEDGEATAVTVANLLQLPRDAAIDPVAEAIDSRTQHPVSAVESGTDAAVQESTTTETQRDEPASATILVGEPLPANPLSAIRPPTLPRAMRLRKDGVGTPMARRRIAVGAMLVVAGVAALALPTFVHAPASSQLPPAPAIAKRSPTTKAQDTSPRTNAQFVSVAPPIGATRHAAPLPRPAPARILARSSPRQAEAKPHVAGERKTGLGLKTEPPRPSVRPTAAAQHETSASAGARTSSPARVAAVGAPAIPPPVRARLARKPAAPYVVVLGPIVAPISGRAAQNQRFAGSHDPATTRPPGLTNQQGHLGKASTLAVMRTSAAPSALPAREGQPSQPFSDVLSQNETPPPKSKSRHIAELGRRASVGLKPSIIPFSVLPASIASGGAARLCVSASRADTLYVSGLGNFDPQQMNCRTVKPAKTTTYVARATNRAGQSAARALTVVVR